MPECDEYLPEAYIRLLKAQRTPTGEELQELERIEKRESMKSRFKRFATKVY